jgi:hypothetical protein
MDNASDSLRGNENKSGKSKNRETMAHTTHKGPTIAQHHIIGHNIAHTNPAVIVPTVVVRPGPRKKGQKNHDFGAGWASPQPRAAIAVCRFRTAGVLERSC